MEIQVRDLMTKLAKDLVVGAHGPALSAPDLRRWAEIVAARADRKKLAEAMIAFAERMHAEGARLAVEQLIALAAIALTERTPGPSNTAARVDESVFKKTAADRKLARLSPPAQQALAEPQPRPSVRLTRADAVHLQKLLWKDGMSEVRKEAFGRLDLAQTDGGRIRILLDGREVVSVDRRDLMARLSA